MEIEFVVETAVRSNGAVFWWSVIEVVVVASETSGGDCCERRDASAECRLGKNERTADETALQTEQEGNSVCWVAERQSDGQVWEEVARAERGKG